MERNPNFTGLFAMSDVMAIGAIRALRDAGKRVPEDVSVVGFDGLAIGEYMVPQLATICQDVQALADQSIRLLQQNIEGSHPARYEIVPVKLEHRESAKSIL